MDKGKIDFSLFLDDYIIDSKKGFQEINKALLALEKDTTRIELLDTIFRAVHTLKSSSKMLEFDDIAALAHTYEDLLDPLRNRKLRFTRKIIDCLFEVVDMLEAMVRERKDGKKSGMNTQAVAAKIKKLIREKSDTIIAGRSDTKKQVSKKPGKGKTLCGELGTNERKQAAIPAIEKIRNVNVHVELLDSLFNLVGEIMINKNRINNLLSRIDRGKDLKLSLASMDRMIGELQENVFIARLVPANEIFQKFPRMVRDLARDANKDVDLVIEGGELELDKAVLDAIGEPLVHLIINAVTHGIETAHAREENKKKKTGTIKLSAARAANHIIVSVEDDGRGIDTEHIKDVAVSKGFMSPEENRVLTDQDVLGLLFKPGFSSTDRVTGLSGRGVGLDVVKTSVKGIGGAVELKTRKGRGTHFVLKLPLTTSIMETLMVATGGNVFAIPSDIVLEVMKIKPDEMKEIHNDKVLCLRDEMIPFYMLNDVLSLPAQGERKDIIAVIIHIGDRFIGLGVDMVLDQMENIIKPFDPIARQFKGFSGGTIMGDGSVAFLLDVPTLFGFETLRKEI